MFQSVRSGFDVPDAAAVRPVPMLVADLITFAAGFAQYDALHSVAIRRWRRWSGELSEAHEKRGGLSINISVWSQLYVLLFGPVPLGMRCQARMHNNEPTNAEIRSSKVILISPRPKSM